MVFDCRFLDNSYFLKRVSIERVVGSYKWRSYRLATLLGITDKDHQYTHFWITFSFLVRYVENGSLANIIKPNKFGPFSESLVAVYIAQVLEGLVYLHE
uniref:non-specific serine/threonine protein kinase n=1 Tax=Gossypium raimondii TaxID=29730 RepID=A0A0D2PQI7_GOSRA|nr:hypothetical protein B456_001G239500 [Gossypium raimondii]KJB06241.1 hypothetical protein B456_001G239500 [Gossypium raimondii]